MKIGFTYDLRQDYLAEGYSEEETAEFDSPGTIEAVEAALKKTGAKVERIGNIRSLVARLAKGERWDMVFNITEGLKGRGREAQVPALLEAYGIPFTFSDSLVMALTLDKALTKRIVRDANIPTAPFAVVENEHDIAKVNLTWPLFAKPLAEGTGKGVTAQSRIVSAKELKEQCRALLSRYGQPVLVEAFLPGREFTVGILGTGAEAEAIGALEVRLKPGAEAHGHTYHNKENCEALIDYVLVHDPEAQEACKTALDAWRVLGCRDAGRVDLRSDARGIPHFLEVNPLSGLNPTHSDLPILASQAGLPYDALIARIVDEALRRHGMLAAVS